MYHLNGVWFLPDEYSGTIQGDPKLTAPPLQSKIEESVGSPDGHSIKQNSFKYYRPKILISVPQDRSTEKFQEKE